MSVYDGHARRHAEAQAAQAKEWAAGIRANGPTNVLEALVASAPAPEPAKKPIEPLDTTRACLTHGGRGCGCS